MPIIVIEPGDGLPFGPGFGIQVALDGVPTMPPDTHWHVSITGAGADETVYYEEAVPYHGSDAWTWGFSSPSTMINWDARSKLPHAKPARLLVELEGTGVTEPSVSQSIVYDTVSGQPFVTVRSQPQIEGGFTEPDRVVLMQMKAWAIWDLVDEFLPDLGEMLAGLLPDRLTPVAFVPETCEPTTLVRPSLPLGVRWMGIRWQVTAKPGGLGVVDGSPDHTYANWGQLSLSRSTGDGITAPYDTRYESRLEGQFMWGTNEPDDVQVYVLPGVCVQFWALTGPPWAVARAA